MPRKLLLLAALVLFGCSAAPEPDPDRTHEASGRSYKGRLEPVKMPHAIVPANPIN